MTDSPSARIDRIQVVKDAAAEPTRRLFPSLPYLALVLGLAAIGSSAIFVKWANAPGPVTGFYRMVIASGLIALPFALQVRRRSPLSMRHLGFAILAGVFFAGDLATWNTAVVLGNAANATLFGNSSPIWVGLGVVVLFKEKLRPAFWAAILITMLGVIVILGEDFFIHPSLGLADLLSLLAGFSYAMFFLATQRARDGLSSLTSWWVSAATSAAILFALAFVLQQPLLGYSMQSYADMVALALVTQVAGWLALNYALGHLSASVVSATMLGQPVITAILGVPLLSQPISYLQIIGGIIVLAGILMVHRTNTQTSA
ncbi:MAG: DMT family transporter [Acidobacteriota bacterium]